MLGTDNTDGEDIRSSRSDAKSLNTFKKHTEQILGNSLSLFFVSTDLKGNLRYINKAFSSHFQIDQHDLRGRQFLDVIRDEDQSLYFYTVKKCINQPSTPHNVVLRINEKGNNHFAIKWEIQVLANDQDEPEGICATGYPLTEQEKENIDMNLFLKSMKGLIILIDNEGVIDWISDNWKTRTGYKEVEIVSQPFTNFLDPDDKVRYQKILSQVVQNECSIDFEHRFKTPDNTWLFLLTTISKHPLTDYIIQTSADITNHKKIEESRREERKMLEMVLAHFPGLVFWKDDQLKYLGCNNAFLRLTGFKEEKDIIGKTDFDMPWVEENAIKYREDDIQVINSGDPVHKVVKTQFKTDKEDRKWYSTIKKVLRDSRGNPNGILSVAVDITDLENSEIKIKAKDNHFRFIAENTSDGIIIFEKGKIIYVSPAFEKLTGYSAKNFVGMEDTFVFKFVHPYDLSNIQHLLMKAKEDKVEHITYSFRALKKNQGYIWREDSANIFYDSQGRYYRSVVVARDITERKKVDELQNEVYLAKENATFKQRFLATMSHEIRTPLTGVLGMSEILQKTTLDKNQKGYLDILMQSGETLHEIINMVLDYSKIEAGEIITNDSIFKLSDIVLFAGNVFNSLKRNKNIEFEFSIDPEIPAYIKTDKSRIKQIISNFISNAVKFTREGSVKLIISLIKDNNNSHQSNERDIFIHFRLKDTGIGIDKEDIPKLFKPFSQITTKKYNQGTGLGLSICRELSHILGGEAGVESEKGVGSEFWFTIKAQYSPDYQQIYHKEQIKEPDSKISKRSLNILVAEDKMVNRKVIDLMLQYYGHSVEFACNGKALIKMFEPGKYDLIIMDVHMPKMDGIETTRYLKGQYKVPDLPPIVGLSADALEGNRDIYIEQGMDEYLSKPVKSKDLENLLNRFF